MSAAPPAIRVRDVSQTYHGGTSAIRALDRVSLDVAPGEFVCLLGASGCGKSTLLNLLGLLEDPDAGDVWFGDARVTALGRSGKSRARGRHIGFVFQSFLLLPSLTALDNVLLAARYVGGVTRVTRQRALDLLAEVGMSERTRHYPPQLSGGEQQRVAIARALAQRPAVILADEPTASLDPQLTTTIMDILRRINVERGLTLVVSQHQLETARAYATRLVGFRAGRVVFDGPPSAATPAAVRTIYGEG